MGFGAVQIGAILFDALFTGVEKLWREMTGLSKGTEDYLAEVKKTKEEDFGNTRSIEDTRLRIDQATEAAKGFREHAEAVNKETLGWRSALNLVAPGAGNIWQFLHAHGESNDASDEAAKKQAAADKLEHLQESSQFHEGRTANIKLQHAGDAALTGQKKITAEFKKRLDMAAEERRYTVEQSKILGNPASAQSGKSTEDLAVSTAKMTADAERRNLQKQEEQELAHLREAALEARLH